MIARSLGGARPALLLMLLFALMAAACNDLRGGGDPEEEERVTTPVSLPEIRAPIAGEISVPPGFTAYRFAEGFQRPTALTLDLDGGIWLAEEGGDIYELRNPGDQYQAEPRRFATGLGLTELLGIAFDEQGTLFASHRGKISAVEDMNGDAAADRARDILIGLPNGRHQNNNLVAGRDGRLYFGNGSTCNACDERDKRSGTIMSVRPDGSEPIVFATGLRNAFGIAFAADGNLYATDNGADPPDVQSASDELNRIVYEDHYGWPGCAGDREIRPGGCTDTRLPVASLQPSSSSDGIAIYEESAFPEQYHRVAFIAQWGANSGDPAIGRRIVTVAVKEERPQEEVFATGFEHPLAVVVDRNGILLVADWGSGVVYAIVYEGPR